MKLPANIFYRRYLNNTIVCDTKNRKFYVMNAIAADILDILSRGVVSNKNVADKLLEQYDASAMEINEACEYFINELRKLGILESDKKSSVLLVNNDTDDTDIDIEQEFIRQLGEKKILYSALIELTHHCNLVCKHCYIINSKKSSIKSELTTQQVINLLDDLYDNNIFRIIFTGGEVFVRSDFLEILEYAISKRFVIDIFSNGTLVSERIAKKIAQFNIRSFQSSLYGSNAKTHDNITGCNGSFEATLQTLKLFSSLGIATSIKSSFMKNNIDEYEGIKALSIDIGASFQPSFSIMPAIDGNKVALPLRVEDSLIISNVLGLTQHDSSSNVKNHISNHICSAGLTGLSINPYGDVYACNTLRIKIGSILNSSIKDIWENSSELEMIRALKNEDRTQCVKCNYFNMCNFCPGIALIETGNMLKPYAEACTIAKAYSNIF